MPRALSRKGSSLRSGSGSLAMLAAMRRASSLVSRFIDFGAAVHPRNRNSRASGRWRRDVSQSVAGSLSSTDVRRGSVALSSSASPVSTREFHKGSELPRTKRRLTDAASKNGGDAPLFNFRAPDDGVEQLGVPEPVSHELADFFDPPFWGKAVTSSICFSVNGFTTVRSKTMTRSWK
jgi:hypothetical protein